MKKRLFLFVLISLFVLSGCSHGFDQTRNSELSGLTKENGYSMEMNAPGKGYANAEMPDPGILEPEETRLEENAFVSVEKEPVSTFSADVDTASYSYFRKLANSGFSLNEITEYAGGNLRTEEMINYFSYDYALPAADEVLGITAKITDCPWNGRAKLLTLGLRAAPIERAKANNLVFLIDVSGSMHDDDKLPLLKKAFSFLTEQLTENDTVSIVTYSGEEAVVLEGCAGNRTAEILNAVNGLEANGSTNGEAGLKKAYEIAAKHFKKEGNNRIIMASDGDLNVGISSKEELHKFVEEKRAGGVYLSVLGFGMGNYRDEKMETLADHGNGVYYYIDGESEARKIFGADLLGTLETVAEDVKLQLTFHPEAVKEYRLVGYENRLLNEEDFTDDTKDAGELGAGHSATVCYELILNDKEYEENWNDAESDWMKLAIRWKNPGEKTSNLREYPIGRNNVLAEPDEETRFLCAVAETSLLLRKSPYSEELDFNSVLSELKTMDLSKDPARAEFFEIIKKLVLSQPAN